MGGMAPGQGWNTCFSDRFIANKSLLTNEKGRGWEEGGGGVLEGLCIVLAVSKDAKCQLSMQFVCPNIVFQVKLYAN